MRTVHILRKTKVAKLVHAIVDEDVGWFEIPMYDLHFLEFPEPQGNLLHNLMSLLFGDASFESQVLLEIAVPTELHYDVDAALGVEDLVELDDVGVFEFVKDLDLAEDGLLKVGVFLEQLEVHLLYCHAQFGDVLEALEDFAE